MSEKVNGMMHKGKFLIEQNYIPGEMQYRIMSGDIELFQTSRQGLILMFHTLGQYLAADERT